MGAFFVASYELAGLLLSRLARRWLDRSRALNYV